MKKIIRRVLFTNEFGETMTLVMDKDNNVFFKHDDIITEFEAYNDMLMNYKVKGKKKLIIGYKYVFSRIEKAVLNEFISDAVRNYGFLMKTDNIPVFEFEIET
jgi:hypothetical protein